MVERMIDKNRVNLCGETFEWAELLGFDLEVTCQESGLLFFKVCKKYWMWYKVKNFVF